MFSNVIKSQQANKLLLLLNKEVQLGKVLNAIAHMALGMGHKFPHGKMPSIDVRFSSSEGVYVFRQLAYKFSQENKNTVFSDFTHTMTEGTADDQLLRTSKTQEKELTYFGVSICGDAEKLNLITSIFEDSPCYILKNYLEFNSNPEIATFDFNNSEFLFKEEVIPPQKVSIVLNNKMQLSELLNPMIMSCLEIGRKANLNSLRLLNFIDKDGNIHPNISYHPFPILLPKNPTKQLALATEAVKLDTIVTSSIYNESKQLATVCIFGKQDEVELLADRKNFSLWKKELTEEDLCIVKESLESKMLQMKIKEISANEKKQFVLEENFGDPKLMVNLYKKELLEKKDFNINEEKKENEFVEAVEENISQNNEVEFLDKEKKQSLK